MSSTSSTIRYSFDPMVWLAGSFAAGVAVAGIAPEQRIAVIIAAFGLSVAAVALREKFVSTLFVCTAFFLVGIFCFQSERAGISENRLKRIYDEGRIASGEPVEIEGVVHGVPEPAADGSFITVGAEKLIYRGNELTVSGHLRLFAPTFTDESADDLALLDLSHGDRIRFACRPEREDAFLNPGVRSRRLILDQQRIDATATLKSPLLVEVMERRTSFSPLSIVFDQRHRIITELREKFGPQTSAVLIAAILGDRYFLDRETADVFREGGTFHILVISGLHITFLGAIILFVVGAFTRSRLLQLCLAASLLWTYAIAVGAGAPVVRACLMFTLLLFSRAIYRKGSLLNGLGACALLLLVWRPSDLFDPSFQLTFVSVAAIVAMAFPVIEKLRAIGIWTPTAEQPFPADVPEWLRRSCERMYWNDAIWSIESKRNIWSASMFKSTPLRHFRRMIVYAFEGVVVSAIVQLWLLPLLVVYFHRISVASIILNLWVGIFLAVETAAAFAAVTVSLFSESLAYGFVSITEFLNRTMMLLPTLFVRFDWASFRVPVYTGDLDWIYSVYLVPVILLAVIVYSWDPFLIRNRAAALARYAVPAVLFVAIGFFGAVMTFHPYSAPRVDGRLHIDFLDVGQGDATLITFPNGETMLIDGGGRPDFKNTESDAFEPDIARVGEFVVSEFLWERGLSRIDHVVATHADADHVQGLADVVRNFDVGSLYVGTLPVGASEIADLLNEAKPRNLVPIIWGRGDELEIGGVLIEVLGPVRVGGTDSSDNNRSVVMKLVYGDHSILFTGDIEREAEIELIESGAQLSATVIKVPHHGSRSSSTRAFIDAVGAQTAVISAGQRNMFGHPHKEVVERWTSKGASVKQTTEKGTITLITDGKQIEMQTFLK